MSIKKLEAALKENIITVVGSAKAVYENTCGLFNLLTDHPVFIERIQKARKKLALPPEGYASEQEAFNWRHAAQENSQKLLTEAEKVLAGFAIPEVFHAHTVNFVTDYLVSVKTVQALLLEEFFDERWKEELQDRVGRKVIKTRLIHATSDPELNKYIIEPSAVYLQIYPTLGWEDLTGVYEEIKKLKKVMLPFSVPKPKEIMRIIWRLRLEGRTPREIILVLKEKYPFKKKVDNHFVDVNTQRYRKALATLLPLPPKKRTR